VTVDNLTVAGALFLIQLKVISTDEDITYYYHRELAYLVAIGNSNWMCSTSTGNGCLP
jgi:hypothetical protein